MKHNNMAAKDTKREVKPNKRFLSTFLLKSLYWYLEVRRAENMSSEMKEEQTAASDETAKNLKAKWSWKIGLPVSWLTPPGTVADEAKATVAIRAAMKENELHVLLSHSLFLSKSSLCVSVNICSGVFPSIRGRVEKFSGKEFFTYCINPKYMAPSYCIYN